VGIIKEEKSKRKKGKGSGGRDEKGGLPEDASGEGKAMAWN